ncbi:acyltransferase [Fictibacillus halophilus]|uniref:acyltransferase n=1 Tax=Fictibacillus halophilus TaxID=1610490 RepID=UPI0036357510
MKAFIHQHAIVETSKIGENTKVWAFSHILPEAMIGQDCNVNDHTFIENDVVIGDRVTIKSGVYIWDGVRINDDVFIGPNVTFTNDLVPRSKQYPEKFIETVIEKGASIGANATIIAGNKIGKYAMVGAGSVVTKNIPNNTLWFGNPCNFKSYICNCGQKLTENLTCPNCTKQFVLNEFNNIEEN